jgi:hypothetical protein
MIVNQKETVGLDKDCLSQYILCRNETTVIGAGCKMVYVHHLILTVQMYDLHFFVIVHYLVKEGINELPHGT